VQRQIADFKLKYVEDYITVTNAKLLYAQNIIDNFNRVTTRFLNLEVALDKLRVLECATWIGTDEDLDSVLNKLTQDSNTNGDQCIKLQRDNDEILEICNNLIAASKPLVMTRPRKTGAGIPANEPNINFKPSSELKPTFLARDCTLPEFLKFGDTFVIYMNSAGTAIPGDAVFSHSRVHIDPYLYTELKQRGLNIKTELTDFPKIIDFTIGD